MKSPFDSFMATGMLRKTTTNLFPRSSSSSGNKLQRSNSGGGGGIIEINKSDYSNSLESDNNRSHHTTQSSGDDNDGSTEKHHKNKVKKKEKKLSDDEIRDKLEKNTAMINGFYNTCQTIVKQNNDLNRRMKILEEHLKIQSSTDVPMSGEDETCSMSNLIEFITGS